MALVPLTGHRQFRNKAILGREATLHLDKKRKRKGKGDTFLGTFNDSTSSQSVLHDPVGQWLLRELAGQPGSSFPSPALTEYTAG